MSLIGDVEHGFSAVINGVEQVGKDVESLVGHAMGDLASLGIGSFGDMAAFVRWLLELGEDPVSVIAALAARAASLGGDVGPVLSEVAAGVLSQGLQGFCTKVLTQAVAPIIGTLTAQITRGDQVAAVHQTTLSTMQRRLTALTTGTTSAGGWQGASPDAMLASFGEISPFLSQLGDQIQHNGQQASLNRTFIQILEGIGVLAAGMVVLDVLLLIVEGVIALFGLLTGPGDILIVGGEALLDAGMVAAEIDILLTLLGADALLWLLGTLLIYAISHPIGVSVQHMSKKGGGGKTGVGSGDLEEEMRGLMAKLGITACAALAIMMDDTKAAQRADKPTNRKGYNKRLLGIREMEKRFKCSGTQKRQGRGY